MTEWKKATPDVLAIAEGIINLHRPDLVEARIGFLFRDKAQKSKGKLVIGKASTIPERLKPYLSLDFMIWVSEEDWNDSTSETRKALIDHELYHCHFGEDGNPKIRAHDVEEFIEIIERHGIWNIALAQVKDAIQGRLPGMKEKGELVAIDPERVPVEAGK